jgi:SNF2 family DNA or RNA helicase
MSFLSRFALHGAAQVLPCLRAANLCEGEVQVCAIVIFGKIFSRGDAEDAEERQKETNGNEGAPGGHAPPELWEHWQKGGFRYKFSAPQMSSPELNEQFLAKIAGWDVIKQARGALAGGRVLSSNWTPPVLKGAVQEGSTSYRAGLVIKDSINIDNLCTCRTSKAWGSMCVHSIAVGLHYLRSVEPAAKAAIPENKFAKGSEAKAPGAARLFRRVERSEDGAKAEIAIIFPPNLAAALAKGKVMLYFEGLWSRGRTPLNALIGAGEFHFSPEDTKVLEAIEGIAGDTPAMFIASPDEVTRILAALVDHPRVSLGKTEQLGVSGEPVRLKLRATLEKNGEITLGLEQRLEGAAIISGSSSTWLFDSGGFQPIFLPNAARSLLEGAVRIARKDVPFFLSQDWPQLEAKCDLSANFQPEDFQLVTATPQIVLELAGGIAHLQGTLHFDYGGRRITVGTASQKESVWMPDPASSTRYGTRDIQKEQGAFNRLQRSGFTGPHEGGVLQLAGQNAVLTFFAREFHKLEREWKVVLEERLERSTKNNIERIEPSFEVTPSGQQWFDLDIAYSTASGETFSNAEIQRLLRSGQSHAKLKNGKFAIIDTGAVEELQEVLLDASPEQHENAYRIHNNQAGFLASALNDNSSWRVAAPRDWREKAQQHSGEAKMEPPPLGKLAEVLRPYQKHGVGWLEFLRRNNFGGILADEMGLGKTLQALAFLKSVVDRTAASERMPSLIVCPTSLVFNWVAEAEKFTPELKVIALQGPRRAELFPQIASADVVITSYALIRRDAEQYRGLEFDTLVLDEAQHIKNRQTQNAQSVKSVRARRRFVLTGTPMENSVLDLWSIFDFLMPGYLGTAADFKERYEVPIAREKDSAAQVRLARRIRPFLLRRLKREVAKDLPEKIEQVSFCDLSPEQQAVYQQLLEASRKEISDAVGQQGLQKSRMLILTALLRLRQVCCDLRLLKLENAREDNSGKLELFNELLQEAIDGGHRVLVFSQFVEMLQLLKTTLQSQNIDFAYLDGSTSDRAKVVQEFQSKDIPVFLISLKAGGVGLNLTAADTVLHFDPWWNPAVEAQATDRAHRIGQTRVVTSYKLITRGTVEEKILHLQNQKRELIQTTLSGEEQLTSGLTWEELQGLFE